MGKRAVLCVAKSVRLPLKWPSLQNGLPLQLAFPSQSGLLPSLCTSLMWPFLRKAFSIVHMPFSLLVAFSMHGAPLQVALSARSSIYYFYLCFLFLFLCYYFVILLFYYFIILTFMWYASERRACGVSLIRILVCPLSPTLPLLFSPALSLFLFLMSFSFLFSRWYSTLAISFGIRHLSKSDSRSSSSGSSPCSSPCQPLTLPAPLIFSLSHRLFSSSAPQLISPLPPHLISQVPQLLTFLPVQLPTCSTDHLISSPPCQLQLPSAAPCQHLTLLASHSQSHLLTSSALAVLPVPSQAHMTPSKLYPFTFHPLFKLYFPLLSFDI